MLTGFTLPSDAFATELCNTATPYIQHGISHQAASVVAIMDLAIYRVLPLQNRPITEKETKRNTVHFDTYPRTLTKLQLKDQLSLHTGSLM